jgi:hypothetical protein
LYKFSHSFIQFQDTTFTATTTEKRDRSGL